MAALHQCTAAGACRHTRPAGRPDPQPHSPPPLPRPSPCSEAKEQVQLLYEAALLAGGPLDAALGPAADPRGQGRASVGALVHPAHLCPSLSLHTAPNTGGFMIESPKDFAARIYGMMEAANGTASTTAGSAAGTASSSTPVDPEVM